MKKGVFILFLAICLLFTLSSVCAGDVNDTIVASDDNQMELSQDSIDDVIEDDSLKSNEIDELLTTNSNFGGLNATINGNDDSDVYLDGNYTFESGADDNFKGGVIINRAVTVHGNGFTIDGSGAARIFTVNNDSVVFKDIIFVNGNTDGDGGAINGKCTAVNCTFNSNDAFLDGGAMYGGSAVNCTFYKNSGYNGGAMCGSDCSAVNCTFEENNAYFGGAMYGSDCSAVNCTFYKNYAESYGGAMYGLSCSASFCTFNSNKARNGGAMRFGSAVNCSFNSNNASNDGGAIHGGSAVNCSFNSNNAFNDGGAMYGFSGSAVNCSFNSNNASNGGAIHGGSALNCIFTSNNASNGGAIHSGSAVNCTFNSNGAFLNGGAMYDCPVVVYCTFNSNSADSGGAMYGEICFAVICTFTSNNASKGGAIHSGSVIGCTFDFNSADYGGAMYGDSCSAVSCSFNFNSADYGGAMYEGSADDCNFNSNNASSGGAMYNGSADICTFYNNSAEYGGALYGSNCSAHDSTFNYNSANYGGAMYNGSAVNCTFNSNEAFLEGGAMYNGSAVNCTFRGNKAYSRGGAIKSGEATNCIFINNSGAMDGGTADTCIFKTSSDTYNDTTILPPRLIINNLTFTYDSGEKLTFNLTTNSSMPVTDGNISISVYYENNSWVGNYSCLSGEGWIVDLPTGVYIAFFETEYEGFTTVNATITVIKKNSTLTVDDFAFDYDSTGSTEVSFTGANGVVAKVKDHDEANVIVVNNVITVSNLNADNYTLIVTTIADENHNNVTKTANFTVNKIDSSVSLDNIVFDYNGKGNATVSLNGANSFEASIEGYPDAVSVEGMVITVSGLNASNYTLKVTTIPDANHNAVTKTVNVAVNKIDSTLTVNGNITFVYGTNGSVEVSFTGATGINVSVMNQPDAMVNVSGNKITVSNLNAGNHTLIVTTVPDMNHNSVNKTAKIIVNKAHAEIIIENATLNVKVLNFTSVGATLTPAEAGNLTYNSTNSSVVMVSGGILMPVGKGQAIITVSFNGTDNYEAVESKNITVTVTLNDASVVVDSATLNLNVGDTYAINATTSPAIVKLFNITYMSSDNSVVTVDKNGTITAIGEGTAVITVGVGDDMVFAKNSTEIRVTVNKINTQITASAITATYNANKNLVVTLKDSKGNAISGASVIININGAKTYITDSNGQIKVNVAKLVPKAYTAKITFAGNSKYLASSANVKVTVKKAKSKIVAKKKTFKKAKKVKKYTITLKSGKTAIKKVQVTLKIKGKKIIKAKTNKKGKATFKIKKLTKKGTYKATIKFKGNKYYTAITKKVKIKIK